MHNWLHKFLPWAALLGAILIIASLIANSGMRAQILTDTGQTTQVVDAALMKIAQLSPSGAEDVPLRAAVKELRASPYLAAVWLFDLQGKVLYSEGATAFQNSIQDRLPADFERIVTSMPAGTLTDEQSLLLKAAAAIQAEGEHNDIYRHQVRPVRDAGGKLVAVVGVAYDISSAVGAPDAGWIASILIFLLGFGLYWLALPAWTYLDASQNGEPAWVWAAFVLLGNVIALIAYLLIRSAPRRSL
jgi:hypothetical protein